MFLHTLRAFSRTQPDKPAIEFVDDDFSVSEVVSYAELERQVLRTMAMLRANGVQPGDRVALQLPKCLAFVYLHLAIMRIGAICLPLNTGYPMRELAYFLEDAAVNLFFAEGSARDSVMPLLAKLPALRACHFLDCDENRFDKLVAPFMPADAEELALPTDADATCLMIYTSGTTGRPKGAELTHGNLTANLDSLHAAWG